MKDFIGKSLIGKAVLLEYETVFIGNIADDEGSVCLNVTAMFDYKEKNVLALADSRGITYFYECIMDDLWVLNPIMGQNEVNSLLEFICEEEINVPFRIVFS